MFSSATIKEFKDFILRGNVIDLAVAVVIGAAFAGVVKVAVEGMVTPLISMFVGESSLDSMTFTLNDSVFRYGAVLDEIIYFLAVAAVVFFLVVKPMNMLLNLRKKEVEVATPPAPELSPEAKRFLEEMTAALQRLS